MILYTGDTHGDVTRIQKIAYKQNLTENDTIVILGDAGYNYYGNNNGDEKKKKKLAKLKCTIFCIHGNHENRPQNIPSYLQKQWKNGNVFYEPEYPNLLFAEDGELYDLEGKQTLVIGGAYSVDKYYRIMNGMKWFPDEQPDMQVKKKVKQVLDNINWTVDQVLSHTCPIKYEPTEVFLPYINQNLVDKSTEKWLGKIEKRLTYQRWLCGHFHINKQIDKLQFLMDEYIE